MKAPLLQTRKSINLKSMFFEFLLSLWDRGLRDGISFLLASYEELLV